MEDISFFWDGFFDNIFTDWQSRNKIKNSLASVQGALYQLRNTITKVEYDIDNAKKNISSLNSRMATVQANLLRERTRMIEDAIKRQQS